MRVICVVLIVITVSTVTLYPIMWTTRVQSNLVPPCHSGAAASTHQTRITQFPVELPPLAQRGKRIFVSCKSGYPMMVESDKGINDRRYGEQIVDNAYQEYDPLRGTFSLITHVSYILPENIFTLITNCIPSKCVTYFNKTIFLTSIISISEVGRGSDNSESSFKAREFFLGERDDFAITYGRITQSQRAANGETFHPRFQVLVAIGLVFILIGPFRCMLSLLLRIYYIFNT